MLALTLIARNPDECGISTIWSFFVASGWFSLMRYLVVLTKVRIEVGWLHLSRCSKSEALHMWYLRLQAEGYQMVVQVLAESVACSDSRLCTSSCCLCGNRWEYVLSVVDTFSCPSLSAKIKASQPWLISKLAWLCLRSCTLICSTQAMHLPEPLSRLWDQTS